MHGIYVKYIHMKHLYNTNFPLPFPPPAPQKYPILTHSLLTFLCLLSR